MYEPVNGPAGGHGLVHLALVHASRQIYQEEVAPFIQGGLNSSEPVLAIVPGNQLQVLRAALGGNGHGVTFADMAVLGRNPARVIPAIWTFLDRHLDQRVRFVSEPVWPGRTADETREVCRHEALINQAFLGRAATILCPYDSRHLAAAELDEAQHNHPYLLVEGQPQPNRAYRGPAVPAACDSPLPLPPATAQSHQYYSDLRQLRRWAARQASRAGLTAHRVTDLVIAVSELAANTLRHTPGPGTAYLWQDTEEIVCQIHDLGEITDPLAGVRPGAPDEYDHGLQIVSQLCDLTTIHSDASGTTIRIRMRLTPPAAARAR
jgi:anti-sigma regulatory factor (Ser/Thr protein kinase)